MGGQSVAEAAHSVRRAVCQDDPAEFRRLLGRFPELKGNVDQPLAAFESPLVTQVRSPGMLDALLEAGADINARSTWWAGGFGLLDLCAPELAAYAIERGAMVSVHAAARLGMMEKLRESIAADPRAVHARGGDGQTPLHFASTVEIAQYLLDHGADIDACDVDHESTPAQYMVRKRSEIARYLIGRGCRTDILMAAALGDGPLAQRHLESDPESIRTRVSQEYFPMTNPKSGGTIYQWELGWFVSAVQVAKSFGHAEIFELLMDRCPPEEKLLNACWLHDEELVRALAGGNRNLAGALPAPGRRQLAHAAHNNDTAAAHLMLIAGLPVDTYGRHHATPLHWAAWHGNAGMVREILAHHPPLEDASNDFRATPMGWAIHGSENGWHRAKGDYAGTVQALLDAGAALPERLGGTEPVQAVLRQRGMRD
jgi:ankyrin repeat protein